MVEIKCKSKDITCSVAADCELRRAHELYPELPIKFGCRRGECGVCAIKILAGKENLTRPTNEEIATRERKNLSSDFRLACQCSLNGGGSIVIE